MLTKHRITSRYAIISSDNCCAGFKNNLFQFYLQYLVDEGVFERIDYKTLIPGHTYSCADRCFGVIEKEALRNDVIELPSDWVRIIERSSLSKSYNAELLTFKDMYDYESFFKNRFTKRFKDNDSKKFRYEESHYFNYGIGERLCGGEVKLFSHPGIAWIRKSIDPKEIPREVSYVKKRQMRGLSHCELSLLRTELKPLPEKVFRDINEMAIKYLSLNAQKWYSKLPCETEFDPFEFSFKDY